MSRKEWIDQFVAINGRNPSEEELSQALASGDYQDKPVAEPAPVSQAQPGTPQQTSSTQKDQPEPIGPDTDQPISQDLSQPLTGKGPRRLNTWLMLGVGLVAVLAIFLAGGTGWRYYSGKLDGTYQLVYLKEHDTGQVHKYENNKYTYTRLYADVQSDKSLQLINQESQASDYDYGYPAIELETYFKTPLKVNPWTRTIDPTQTPDAFSSYLTKLLNQKFSDRFSSKEELQSEVETYVNPYKDVAGDNPKNIIDYRKDGDKVTVTIRKRSGKARYTMIFKQLSDKESKKVLAQYQKDRRQFEKLYRTY